MERVVSSVSHGTTPSNAARVVARPVTAARDEEAKA
jgi:hypothetical protein